MVDEYVQFALAQSELLAPANMAHGSQPEEALLRVFEDVSLFMGNDANNMGSGKLKITSNEVLWLAHKSAGDLDAEAADGGTEFAIEFRLIILHAICRDANAFPHPCIYCQLDLNNALCETSSEIRFVPADSSSLDDMFNAFSEGAALNPEEEDCELDANGGDGMGTATGMTTGMAMTMGTDVGIDDAGELFTDAAQVQAALVSGTAEEQEERQRCLAHLDSVLDIGGLRVDDETCDGTDMDARTGTESTSFALAERLAGTVDGQFDDANARNAAGDGTGIETESSAEKDPSSQLQAQSQLHAPPQPPQQEPQSVTATRNSHRSR